MEESEICQLGTGRGNREEDLIGKIRDVNVVVAAVDDDIEEGEVREVREERGDTVVRGEAEKEVGLLVER
ncbi:hypothetical protein RHMOL_Rhmol08G0059400 [Rhododendron molle]|uniref:Uncharacterized protein n=1 Tax=Rhododendron molle TaxID=49168 RepID=A0ACC0MKB7_RHOML|nr:hypothetical protein RHMOL_Rhmol08G0059400 [Rhododendron molle]